MLDPSRYEFALLEWLWDTNFIRLNLPGSPETQCEGSYAAVVAQLSALGNDGWDVVTSTSTGNWIIWTLRRPRDSWKH